jgi:hypothetical protein
MKSSYLIASFILADSSFKMARYIAKHCIAERVYQTLPSALLQLRTVYMHDLSSLVNLIPRPQAYLISLLKTLDLSQICASYKVLDRHVHHHWRAAYSLIALLKQKNQCLALAEPPS